MTTATDMLAKYLEAEAAILDGKEVRLADRMVRLEDLEWVQKGRREWESKVSSEQARAAGVQRVGGLTFSLARFDGC